jgi:DNA-binding LacI/PurR family transcriptional regulator
MAEISAAPRVTSVDVARRAGVSQSTVSLVLSGKGRGRISAKTEEAVRAAAAELGYRPNVAARTLRTGVARTVGLVVPDITNPFFGPMLRGAQKAAMQAGYTVMLVDIGEDRKWESRSVEALLAGPSDGLLLFETGLPPGAELPAIGIEVVPGELPVVRLDVESGITQGFEHLLGLGHTKFAHLAADFDAQTFKLRVQRIDALLARAGLEPPVRDKADITFAAASRAALKLLDSDATAFVCDDDIMAGGLYLAARERGVRIPEDISVVGFDDLAFAVVLDPPLTTVRADAAQLGATAFHALAAMLAGNEPPEDQVLPVKLVVRGSTTRR